ncbi:MAG TPA: NAD(+)/NADH kinase [Terriglobales bacterium]
MKRVAIISKQGKPELGRVAIEVTGWLRSHGYSVTVDGPAREFCPDCALAERDHVLGTRPDFVIVLGGDGTLLGAARKVAAAGIPILGINLGSLGFLTEIKQEEIARALEDVDCGRYEVSERAMLHCQVLRQGQTVASYDALNDVVLNQQAVARITEFELRINGIFVSNYKADGLIISTPTGSTAYSLAAGGPILVPEVPGFLVTPVASHALTNRPLVVQDNAVIEIRLMVTRERGYLTIDGQQGVPLEEGDIVQCRKSKSVVKLFRLPERTFFQVLRTKLKWGER